MLFSIFQNYCKMWKPELMREK